MLFFYLIDIYKNFISTLIQCRVFLFFTFNSLKNQKKFRLCYYLLRLYWMCDELVNIVHRLLLFLFLFCIFLARHTCNVLCICIYVVFLIHMYWLVVGWSFFTARALYRTFSFVLKPVAQYAMLCINLIQIFEWIYIKLRT